MRVSKEAVDAIVDEMNQIDIKKIELNEKALKFLKTLEAYLHCLDELEKLYGKIDPSCKLAEYDMPDIKRAIQQVSKTGRPVKNIVELYEAAEAMLPVFKAKIKGLLKKVQSSGAKFKLAPLKGKQRASEKAQDDYSNKVPGPPESWLYDIVRGSVLFDKAEHLLQFLELLRADESIVIVKSKNRFRNPTLSGYRDFNMQIQITNDDEDDDGDNDGMSVFFWLTVLTMLVFLVCGTESAAVFVATVVMTSVYYGLSISPFAYLFSQNGSKHICELQLHIKALKEADIELKSHSHYEFFRVFYSGATGSLRERMGDLKAICKGDSLDMAFLANVVKNPLEVDRMTRLANLFADHMNEYQLAIVITNAARESLEPHDWYMRMGGFLQLQGKIEEALTLLENALGILLETIGPDNEDVASCYNDMACILSRQGKLEEALTLNQKALGIQITTLGPGHTDVARSILNIGNKLKAYGRLEEAMTLYKKALHIFLDQGDNVNVATCCGIMAKLLEDQGRFEEATELHKKALDILLKALGSDHILVANSYHRMGNTIQFQGKSEEAMLLHQKGLDIRLRVLGSDHTAVAESYISIGIVLGNQGKWEQAVTHYQKAVDIQVKTLGPDHTDIAMSYNNMAVVLRKQGKLNEALIMYQKAMDINLKAFGPEHPGVAGAYMNMANVFLDYNQEEAMKFAQKACGIFLKVYGPRHRHTIYCKDMIEYIQSRPG